MKSTQPLLAVLIAVGALLSGCASNPSAQDSASVERPTSFRPARLMSQESKPSSFWSSRKVSIREIVLNGHQPVDLQTQIQLVSVQQDETTVIRTPSGRMLVGRPGDYFSVPGMKKGQGIQLLTVSPQQGEALFEQRMVSNRDSEE